MIYAAEVASDLVARVVVVSDDGGVTDGLVMIGPDNTVGIGWLYVDGEFLSTHEEESPAG